MPGDLLPAAMTPHQSASLTASPRGKPIRAAGTKDENPGREIRFSAATGTLASPGGKLSAAVSRKAAD